MLLQRKWHLFLRPYNIFIDSSCIRRSISYRSVFISGDRVNLWNIHKSTCQKRGGVRHVTTWSPLAAAFNCRTKKDVHLIWRKRTGLFNYSELQEPNGFYLLKEESVIKANHLVNEAVSPHRNRPMVQIFDDLSDTLCRVADLAEFIRIGHPDSAFSSAAETASVSISSLVEELNTNRQLYDSLKKVVDRGDVFATDDVENHVAQLFLFDFEQSGISLDDMKRERVVALNDYILHVGSNFMSGTMKPRSVLKSQLPENIRHCFTVQGDSVLVTSLFADSDNELVREAAYKIFLFPDGHQAQLLDELLKSRNELAQLCDFPTFAHRALRGSLAGSPEVVQNFLQVVSDGLKLRAEKDYGEMLYMKQRDNKYCKVLMPWDTPYYTALAKHERFQVKGGDYCPYFSLGACMDGLNNLFQSLYGVTLQVCNVVAGEVWHTDVVKIAVCEGQDILGYIYCDFYERPGKANQDCHFTIQGGRQLEDGTYQFPVVVLMLSLPPPTYSAPSLLTPSMVDNLFHEMGHAMHSMMARTKYQHVTGTRCSTDLAEVPSVLMEYFSSDPRVISQFARHYQTGKSIPDHLLQSLLASKKLFSSSELQLQVFYAALDQVYHGKHPLGKSSIEVLKEIQEKYYSLPYVPNTAWQLKFGHLVGYGAKYYAYIMSRAVASWIWLKYFRDDPYSRVAGERYRKEVLAHGGAKPPYYLVEDYIGEKITPERMCEALLEDVDGNT